MSFLSDYRGSGLIISTAERAKLGNVTVGFLGSYADAAALAAAHPTAADGNFALNQATNTIWIWDTATVAWIDTLASSIGDMLKSVYDPQNISADSFTRANHTGTQLAATISDFAATVSANTAVAANTAAQHTHGNAAVLNALTNSGSGVVISTAERAKLAGLISGEVVYITKSAAYTIVAGENILANSSAGSFVLTLPLATVVGQVIKIVDMTGSWATNNVTIATSGVDTIMGAASPLILNVSDSNIELISTGANDWRIK